MHVRGSMPGFGVGERTEGSGIHRMGWDERKSTMREYCRILGPLPQYSYIPAGMRRMPSRRTRQDKLAVEWRLGAGVHQTRSALRNSTR